MENGLERPALSLYSDHVWPCSRRGFQWHCVLATKSCAILCDPIDYNSPGFSVYGSFPGKHTRVGCHFLLQKMLPDPGIKPALASGFFTTEPPGKPFSGILHQIALGQRVNFGLNYFPQSLAQCLSYGRPQKY